ncbi:MAG: hypothetical protein GEU99_25715 [Luteitalea sp.]|nr:hypothetical protein [Luteitalea sp.]
MTRPIIALLTDFGLRDHYVGTMKAVAAGICPETLFIDITHEIPPHDVTAAARELATSFRFFPAVTVFLVVVDPGVGSARRGLAAQAGQYRFVAPDNGVLSGVFAELPPTRIVELTEHRYFLPSVSRTFEGRDRFAPAAAWLARGSSMDALGRTISDPVMLDLPKAVVCEDEIAGAVVHIDRFGNLITNIDRRSLERLMDMGAIEIRLADRTVTRHVDTYADIGHDEICALMGSADTLEIAARSASAAALTGCGRLTTVLVRRAKGSRGARIKTTKD